MVEVVLDRVVLMSAKEVENEVDCATANATAVDVAVEPVWRVVINGVWPVAVDVSVDTDAETDVRTATLGAD